MKPHMGLLSSLSRGRATRPRSGANAMRPQSGQTLLEVALLLPLLVLLLLGVIEMGRYAYISILVGNAARAGVAYGAQTHITAADTAGIVTAADNDFQNNGQSVGSLNVISSYSCGCDSGGNVTVLTCSTGTCPVAQHE